MTKRKLPKLSDNADLVSKEDQELFLNAFFQGSLPNKYEEQPKKSSKSVTEDEGGPSFSNYLTAETDREIFLAHVETMGVYQKEPPDAKPPKRRSKNAEFDAKIDLHGDFSKDAVNRLQHFLRECGTRGYKVVLIIHGRGSGVLRKVVADILSRHPLVYDFGVAKARLGGPGAVLARLCNQKRIRKKS